MITTLPLDGVRRAAVTLVWLVGFCLMTLGTHATAQPLGTFRWQLLPYCNVVTLNVTQQGAVFTFDGFDDQCGAGQRASAVGTAFLNPDGSIGIGLNTVLAPGAAFVHVDARISSASLGGPWRDSAGNSGTFVFTPGAGSGGQPRPVAPNGIAPGSITPAQIAPGAVGATQLATGAVTSSAIAAGSITQAHLQDAPRAAAMSGPQFVSIALDTVVRSLTLTLPAAGTVLVSANGYFELQYETHRGQCLVTTGVTVDEGYVADAINGANHLQRFPFALTRTFPVDAGSFTVNLVCRGRIGGLVTAQIGVGNTSLTALFIAGS